MLMHSTEVRKAKLSNTEEIVTVRNLDASTGKVIVEHKDGTITRHGLEQVTYITKAVIGAEVSFTLRRTGADGYLKTVPFTGIIIAICDYIEDGEAYTVALINCNGVLIERSLEGLDYMEG